MQARNIHPGGWELTDVDDGLRVELEVGPGHLAAEPLAVQDEVERLAGATHLHPMPPAVANNGPGNDD